MPHLKKPKANFLHPLLGKAIAKFTEQTNILCSSICEIFWFYNLM